MRVPHKISEADHSPFKKGARGICDKTNLTINYYPFNVV